MAFLKNKGAFDIQKSMIYYVLSPIFIDLCNYFHQKRLFLDKNYVYFMKKNTKTEQKTVKNSEKHKITRKKRVFSENFMDRGI